MPYHEQFKENAIKIVYNYGVAGNFYRNVKKPVAKKTHYSKNQNFLTSHP